MSDDSYGIDRLRSVVDEVAASLDPPAVHPRRRRHVRSAAAALGGLALLAYAGWRINERSNSPAALGIEVKTLRIAGREVDPRVFDSAAAGTIVIVPDHPLAPRRNSR